MIETTFLSTMKSYGILESIRCDKIGIYGFFSHVTKPYKSIVITDISNSNPAVITAPCHNLMDIDQFAINNVVGMTEINSNTVITDFTITDENTITLTNIDSSTFSSYLSGGELRIVHQNDTTSSFEFGCEDEALNNVRKNIIGLRKIDGDCASMVISRNNWVSGNIYDQYDTTKCKPRTIFNNCACSDVNTSEPYSPYTMNSNGDVYFCVNNRNNALSFFEPTHTTPWLQSYGDGYVWQYMYSLDLVSDKFVTDTYIPIRDLCVDDGSNQWNVISSKKHATGEIANISIVNAGSGYSDGTYEVDISGDGAGAVASITVENGIVITATVSNLGGGYSYGLLGGNFTSNTNEACFKVNVFPHYGIGVDQVFNFAPCKIMFVYDFNSDENGKFMIDNSYCGHGILMNPKLQNGEIAKGECYDTRKKLTLTNAPSTMQLNERISNNNTASVVTEVNGINQNVVSILPENPIPFEVGDVVSGELSGSINTILTIEESEILNGSGAIVTYSLDERTVNRDINQRERYRVILEL